MRQVGLATLNYESAFKRLPPGAVINYGTGDATNSEPWGVYGRILPYVEQQNVLALSDLGMSWEGQMKLDKIVLPVFQCPSDVNVGRLHVEDGKPSVCPITYGFNHGTWLVADAATSKYSDGVFFPKSFLKLASVIDGTSHTVLASEVKSWQPLLRNGGSPSATIPSTPAELIPMMQTAPEFRETGHTEWPEGRVHQTGFTSTLAPNTKVMVSVSGTMRDLDYSSWEEGADGLLTPTYAAVTSRSYHTGLVQTGHLDGSVRTYSSSVELFTWRALSTRAGGEVVDASGE